MISLSCTCAVAQNTPTFYMAVNLIVSPINVETFFVLEFVISLLKLKSNDLIPFF